MLPLGINSIGSEIVKESGEFEEGEQPLASVTVK